MRHMLRDPKWAALFGALVTMLFLNLKDKFQGIQGKNSRYFKPGFLVGVLVYFIVSWGQTEII